MTIQDEIAHIEQQTKQINQIKTDIIKIMNDMEV